jgi:hypothetical protein
MSTDKRGAKILARTFFNQLRAGGYTPSQIIAISTELIDLVTVELREGDDAESESVAAPESRSDELRPSI